MRRRKNGHLRLVCLLCLLGADTEGRAAPLNLTLNPSPDITSLFLELDYNAATDSFTLAGYNVTIDDDNSGPLIDFDDAFMSLNFNIAATVNSAGNALSGSLQVAGDLTSSLGISGVLLTGDLVQFGFESDDPGSGLDLFEFEFTVTGGVMATSQYFGPPGSRVGVIYQPFEDVFDGTFSADFAVIFNASSQTNVAPIAQTIADARALPLGSSVTIEDAVIISVTDHIASTANKTFQIQDVTGALTVFGSNAAIDAIMGNVGDRISLTGTTGTFRGLFELLAPFVRNSINPGVAPPLSNVTVSDFQNGAPAAELLESRLVVLPNVHFTSSGTFAALGSYPVTDLSGTLFAVVRISTSELNMVGSPIPAGDVTIIGVFTQFDSVLDQIDQLDGYQLLPRSLADLGLDCNQNGISDVCEVDCAALGGACNIAGCGTASDCNDNAVPDDCELDTDFDGRIDVCDSCPTIPNGPGFLDTDSDTLGDACDNCPAVVNLNQNNADGDNHGDACDTCCGFPDDTDCDNNGIADGCEITPADGGGCPSAPSAECALQPPPPPICSKDCNRNGVPDGCDIGLGESLDVIDNFDGSPGADGIPDECSNWNAAQPPGSDDQWSNAVNWNPSDTFPDNGNLGRDFAVTIGGATTVVELDVPVQIDSLFMAGGAQLNLTQGDMTFTSQIGLENHGGIHVPTGRSILAATSTVFSGTQPIRLDGSTATITSTTVANTITLSAPVIGFGVIDAAIINQSTIDSDASGETLEIGGVFSASSDGTLRASDGGTLLLNRSVTGAGAYVANNGGIIDIPGTSPVTVAGSTMDVTNGGALNVAGQSHLSFVTAFEVGGCAGFFRGCTPPVLGLRDSSSTTVGGNFICSGLADVTVESGTTFDLAGNYDNQCTSPTTFHWDTGPLTMNGAAPQTFEAAGEDFGPLDPAGYTDNFAMGTLRLEPGRTVDVLNTFDNIPPAGCEALYVDTLSLGAGATLNLNGCNVYYHNLVKESGATVILLNGAALMSTDAGDLDGDDVIDFDDLNQFIDVLFGGSCSPACMALADINGDGAIDGLDIALMAHLMTGW